MFDALYACYYIDQRCSINSLQYNGQNKTLVGTKSETIKISTYREGAMYGLGW